MCCLGWDVRPAHVLALQSGSGDDPRPNSGGARGSVSSWALDVGATPSVACLLCVPRFHSKSIS